MRTKQMTLCLFVCLQRMNRRKDGGAPTRWVWLRHTIRSSDTVIGQEPRLSPVLTGDSEQTGESSKTLIIERIDQSADFSHAAVVVGNGTLEA